MTVSSELSRKTYAGNGVTTSFATSPMVFFDDADLVVYDVVTATGASTLLVLTTDYTVTGGDGSTGSVVTTGLYGAIASGHTLVIVRDIAATQGSDFVNNDASDAEVVEDALDRLTMLAQQNEARAARSFTLLDSDVSGASTTLPTPEAGMVLGWDGTGLALENVDPADVGLASVASTTAAGLVELATSAETVTGTDAVRAVTPAGLTARMAAPGAIGGTTPAAGAFTTLTATGQPAFLAYRQSTVADQTGDATSYTVVCDGEVFDPAANYNTTSGVFTAPTTGRYLLTFQCTLAELAAGHTQHELRINTSNRNHRVVDIFGSNAFTTRSMLMSVVTDMDAADTATFVVRISGATKVVDVTGDATDFYTFVSGAKLPC